MSIGVGINGFGRIGRLALRAAWGWEGLAFLHINEINADAQCSAHLLEFDSIHGRWTRTISAQTDAIIVDSRWISYTSRPDPGEIDWIGYGVDLVVEASGEFRTVQSLERYFDQGIRKVVVAAPIKDPAVLNIVMGVNDRLYQPEVHHLVTAASCTTNCLVPVVKVLHEGIGIRHGTMTTIHNATNTQTIIDKGHKDLRRARASSLSLIPTTTGSAKAIGDIFPELSGKLNGLAVRVPLLNASLTDFVFEAERETTVEQVNALLKNAANGSLRGILGYEERPLVSIDYKDDTRSCIVDALSTMVIDGTQVKTLAWYDNEIGYVHRLMELVRRIASLGYD